MTYTAKSLVRELANRYGDLALATAADTGTTTSLVAPLLVQYFPADVSKFYPWVYGGDDADTANRGIERRASDWSAASTTLTVTAMPHAMTTGTYEIHARMSHARKLEAINAAVRLLYLSWWRTVVNETLTTVAGQYRYTLPSTIKWSYVGDIDLQISTDATLVGYPYRGTGPWNARTYKAVSSAGVETWYLQFVSQPPPDRTIRLYAEAGYDDLVADADILPIAGNWGGAAYEWILDYAEHKLWDWDTARQPAGQVDRTKFMSADRLDRAKKKLLETAPAHSSSRIIVPGMGTGRWDDGVGDDESYFGAFHSGGMS